MALRDKDVYIILSNTVYTQRFLSLLRMGIPVRLGSHQIRQTRLEEPGSQPRPCPDLSKKIS